MSLFNADTDDKKLYEKRCNKEETKNELRRGKRKICSHRN